MMTKNANENLVQRWLLDVWGGGQLDLVGQLVSAEYTFSAPGIPEARGPQGATGLIAMYRTAFPDMTNTIEEQYSDGEVVITKGSTRGTHKGPLGPTAATGRSVTVPWIMISRLANGRIASDYEVYDAMGLMQQLGVIPS
jgi:predicted ester cyclase